MRSSTILSAASLLGLAAAIPAAADPQQPDLIIAKRDPPAATAPWVEVDDGGQPKTTYTPSATVVDASTSIQDAAPHDLTASVYTETWYGEIETRTGDPPNPTPTGKGDQGAFTRCFNMDGKNAPFCAPAENSILYTDKTYYVTWDPDFFNTSDFSVPSNRTLEISLRLHWYNASDSSWSKLKDLDSSDDRVPAKWGFFPFKASKKFHKEWQKGTTNLTITLVSSVSGSKERNESEVALPVVLQKHLPPQDKPAEAPSGQTLYIALPAVFGSIILLLIGGCLWNRKTRRIQLGNVMGRNRKGYTGRRARRMLGIDRNKSQDINLDVRPVGPIGGGVYHDVPEERLDRYNDDDDALGSLAGTPVDDRFPEQGTAGASNAFRDEISRQDRQRRAS